MAYYYCGALCFVLCLGEGFGDCFGVGSVDSQHIPSPCCIFCSHILAVNGVDVGRELHAVAVVEHYEVAQAEESGDTAGTLRDFFLNTAVADEGVGLVGNDVAEACLEETFCDGASHGHCMALSEGTGCVLDAAFGVKFGVSRGYAAPLAELLEFGSGELACEGKHRIKHWRHVAGVEEEAVACEPCGVVRVGDEKPGIKHIHEVGATHGATRVP